MLYLYALVVRTTSHRSKEKMNFKAPLDYVASYKNHHAILAISVFFYNKFYVILRTKWAKYCNTCEQNKPNITSIYYLANKMAIYENQHVILAIYEQVSNDFFIKNIPMKRPLNCEQHKPNIVILLTCIYKKCCSRWSVCVHNREKVLFLDLTISYWSPIAKKVHNCCCCFLY